MLQLIQQRRDFIDEPNEFRLLRLVRDARQISRVELSRRTMLSKTTVSEIVNRFIRGGFLRAVGEGPSTEKGGRKTELLEFNPGAAFVIGVDIERTSADVAVTDLNAQILHRTTIDYPAGTAPDVVLGKIQSAIRTLTRTKKNVLTNAVGIGVGLPGVIDQSSGSLKVADTLQGWQGINIGTVFKREFGLPVFVENDVKARTLGELIFGAGRNVHELIYLWIGDGIGAGIVIDGKLYHGFTSSAGEIGYTLLSALVKDRRAFPMLYHRQRELGQILSNAAVTDAFRKAKYLRSASIKSVLEADEHKEAVAVQILDEVSELVGHLCINLINTINPEKLLLGGELFRHGDRLMDRIQLKIRGDSLSIPASAVRIERAALSEDGVLLGSVGHVLYDLFKPSRDQRSSWTAA